MSGQHQIYNTNRNTLFNKHNKLLMNQVDLEYLSGKFAVKTEYKETDLIHNYLLKELYETKNCEVLDFLNKKLNGALGDENIDIVNLKSMQIKYRDINNYYYTSPSWTEEQW